MGLGENLSKASPSSSVSVNYPQTARTLESDTILGLVQIGPGRPDGVLPSTLKLGVLGTPSALWVPESFVMRVDTTSVWCPGPLTSRPFGLSGVTVNMLCHTASHLRRVSAPRWGVI